MGKKASPTRTTNPLPFQDLDPHRFEDLVRNLIYDFRPWRTIEATGKAGSDEGFDIRAWEVISTISNKDEDEGEDEVGVYAMDGNLWKIQCKREKQIGPNRVKQIIEEGIDKSNPPYGYLLAASTTFSKKSYDVFRAELRAKGVMEFYLWGKPELEDMLFLPKNDNILFAFFGFSLITRKRVRSTEIKFAINNKNKLLRILAKSNVIGNLSQPVLTRDFKDVHYPWKDEYKNFHQLPRWKEFSAKAFHPLGIIMDVRKHFAYVNNKTKEYDFFKGVDLLIRQSEDRDEEKMKLEQKIRRFWRYLPRANRAQFVVRGLISFEDMLIIDEKGDSFYEFPHIFVDFKGEKGPFRWFVANLMINDQEIRVDDTYKQIAYFPAILNVPKPGKKHEGRLLELDDQTRWDLHNEHSLRSLFDVTGKFDFLGQRDIIQVADGKSSNNKEKTFLEITQRYKASAKEYLNDHPDGYRELIEKQIGQKLKDSDELSVLEYRVLYEWELDEKEEQDITSQV